MLQASRFPIYLWFGFALAVCTFSYVLVQSSPFAVRPDLFSLAITLDLTLILPGLYFFAAWRCGWPKLSVIPVFVVCLVAANVLLPDEHQAAVGWIEIGLFPLEIAAVAVLIYKVRKITAGYRNAGTGEAGFIETLEEVLSGVLGNRRLARLLVTEISVFHYALFAWRKEPETGGSEASFSYHVNCGYGAIVAVFVFLILLETICLHILLSLWSVVPAWTVTAISLYSLLFLVADYNASRLRPIVIEGDDLILRIGLRWRAPVTLSDLREIRTGSIPEDERKRYHRAVLFGSPNVFLELDRPCTLTGFYGIERKTDRVALAVDAVEGFVKALPIRNDS
jgi:hypothetical protein